MTDSGHIFISYARKDGESHAIRFDDILPKHGFPTWRDKRGIDPARDFTAEIENAIEAASCVVMCMTPDVRRDNSFVRREIGYAQVVKRPIIVARFADVPPPISVINNTWLDFFRDWDTYFIALCDWLRKPDSPLPTSDDPFRDYLDNQYKYVVQFLNQTVISQIDLESETTPDAVNAPAKSKPESKRRDMMLDFFAASGLDTDALADDTPQEQHKFANFNAAFEHYDGRLLLLGEPGAGKTITLMSHARDAIAARLEDTTLPLPLLGLIPTWNSHEQTAFAEWLTACEKLELPQVERVIDEGRALLLLDGLDELGSERIENIKDKNSDSLKSNIYDPRLRFIDHIPLNNHIMITCRIREYADLGVKLALTGAVTLQSLTDEKIEAYLQEVPDLWAAVQADTSLWDMLKTPLLLSLFAFAYRSMSRDDAEKLRDLSGSPGKLRAAIINQYIDKRYAWEERRTQRQNEILPFTLEKIRGVLSRMAMANAAGVWGWRNEELLGFVSSDHALEDGELEPFINLVVRLHLLVPREDGRLRFIHLKIQDMFAVDGLINVLEGDVLDYDINREVIAFALGELRDERALNRLIFVLGDGSEDGVFRSASAIALGKIADTRAVDSLITALCDEDENVQNSAVIALGDMRDARAVRPLVNILKNLYVRENALISLRKIGTSEALVAVEEWERKQQ